MPQARGEFEVTREMQPGCELGDGIDAMHVRFDKRFSGPLEATSVVHMLAVHKGIMDRGAASLDLAVVPDSGTDDLAGISGTMAIDIVDGHHYYTLDYTL